MNDPIDGLRLYRVELTQAVYVLAKDELAAELDAANYAHYDDMGEPDAMGWEVKSTDRICEDTLESLPHWDRQGDPPTVREAIAIIAARTGGEK